MIRLLNPKSHCLAIALAIAGTAGCHSAGSIREPEAVRVADAVAHSWRAPDPMGQALPPVFEELAGPRPVEEYVAFALSQNPEIQAARWQLRAAASRLPQAAALPDPMLGTTVHAEPIQTAAGQQELALSASQKVPWPGKLRTRVDMARRQWEVARHELIETELRIIEQVRVAYYRLYSVEQVIAILEADRDELDRITRLVDRLYRIERRVDQQDDVRANLEVSQMQADLIELYQEREAARARLARLLHVSSDTELATVPALPSQDLEWDLDALRRRAIGSRPELQAALASLEHDRQAADLARLAYFPDVTWGVSWIDTASAGISPVANGRDAVLLSVNMNVPLYRRSLEAGVREAEQRVAAGARRYDALKDMAVEEVARLFAQAQSQQEMLTLLRAEMIPLAELSLRQTLSTYEQTNVNFLDVIESWRRMSRLHRSEKQVEAQYHQTLAQLARAVGAFELESTDTESILAPLPEPAPLPEVPQP